MNDDHDFVLVLTRRGVGCDATIGCGARIESLDATTLEGARAACEPLSRKVAR